MSGPAATLETEPSTKTSATTSRTLKVAYVLSRFPKLTETFVLYEILALKRQGVPVEIYPLLGANHASTQQGASLIGKILELFRKPAHRPMIHADAVPLVQGAHYGPMFSWPIFKAQLHFLRRKPLTYLSALGTLVRATLGSWNFLVGGLATFPKTAFMARHMQETGVTRVHAHFANHPAASAFVVHRLTGIPYSFTAHGSDLHVDRHMLRDKVSDARTVVTVSEYNKNLIAEECGEEYRNKIQIIRCGVDTQTLRPTPAKRRRQSGDPLSILCIGTMHEVKGHTHLIEACRLLKGQGIRFVCHLVGGGPDRKALEQQVRDSGLDECVVFHGQRTREDVAALLEQADVLAAPSVLTSDGRREGIPVVLMEAMSCGLPVVASRLSGIPELVEDGRNGLLTPPRDAEALAAAMTRLYGDPQLCIELGEAGRRKVVDEFDVHKNAAALAHRFAGEDRAEDVRHDDG